MEKSNSLLAAVKSLFGQEARILRRDSIHGGDINNAWRVEVAGADAGNLSEAVKAAVDSGVLKIESSGGKCTIFVKTNSIENADFFRCESLSLECIKNNGAIGVPDVLAWGTDQAEGGNDAAGAVGAGDEVNAATSGATDTLFSIKPFCFLILPYLQSAPKNDSYWEDFGHELAMMHCAQTDEFCPEKYGFLEDNFIGKTAQKNTASDSWVEFFRSCRLEPQLKMAWNFFDDTARKKAESILSRLESLIPEPEIPSLLHGDLWSGNIYTGPDGKAWVLDPACFVGHYEADLAMTNLFGALPARFYNSYDEVNRIDSYFLKRMDLYNLYHLLNHLNMFGTEYLGNVLKVLDEYK